MSNIIESLLIQYIPEGFYNEEIITSINNGITETSSENDILLYGAQTLALYISKDPVYSKIATILSLQLLLKESGNDYRIMVEKQFQDKLVSKQYYDFFMKYYERIVSMMYDEYDTKVDYFGLKTLERAYIIKSKYEDKFIETPQLMLMRVSIQIHGLYPNAEENLEETFEYIKESFDVMYKYYFTHATPTLFNSGTDHTQLSSCYLLQCPDDTEEIGRCCSNMMKISKWAGGIGVNISDIRHNGAMIESTGGKATGIVALAKHFNSLGKCFNQCFVPSTIVYTTNGPKRIDEISLGEYILTKNGKQQVLDIIVNNVNKDILEIHVPFMTNTCQLTKEHQIYVIKECNKDTMFAEYISASELQIGDLMGFPKFPSYNLINRAEEECKFYNNILKFGYIKNNKVNIDHINYHIQTYLDDNKLDYTIINDVLSFNKDIVKEFIENDKLIIPYNIIYYNKECIKTIIDKVNINNFDQISQNLFVHASLECSTLPNIKVLEHDNMLWYNPSLINTVSYSGDVYDLLVNDNHTYITTIGLVHNSGKRNGAIATYLEVWHPEIFDYVELRKTAGNEDLRARDIFNGLWICDAFMKAVNSNADWYLMNPNECKGLTDTYGEEFEKLYYGYVEQGKYVKKIRATDLFDKIITTQVETGLPYMLYKDACNKHSNHNHLGTIKNSNLCTEIIQYSNPDEIAVCNLASVSLPSFVKQYKGEQLNEYSDDICNEYGYYFDFSELIRITKIIVRNLNKIIDINYYPVKECSNSNLKHRPIGIGIQGLADTYIMMGYSFSSDKADNLNKKIFQTIYYAALKESNELAKKYGHYESFPGSAFSKGQFQFHMYGKTNADIVNEFPQGYKYGIDWDELVKDVKQYGTRNSLLTTCMPTGSTAQIMGNSEGIEPIPSNMFVRKVLAGEFLVVNKNLINDLKNLGLWTKELYNELRYDNGSVQNLNIPKNLKEKYLTAFEMKQSVIVKQAVSRQIYIDQSQSMNLFMDDINEDKLKKAHMYGWKHGLKTGMYYMRTRPVREADQFNIDIDDINKIKLSRQDNKYPNSKTVVDEPYECYSCSA